MHSLVKLHHIPEHFYKGQFVERCLMDTARLYTNIKGGIKRNNSFTTITLPELVNYLTIS
jgi:hypothetical protein